MSPPARRSRKKLKQIETDAKRFIWHPFTQMAEWEDSDPLVIERGKGVYLFDIHGRKYLDGVSSIWVNIHGHRKPALDRALKKQAGQIAHSTLLGLSNIPAIRLARELVRITPRKLKKVFFSDNGSTAVEIALKIAFQYWRLRGRPEKSKFFGLANAYHGDTIGSVSLGGIPLFHQSYSPLLFPTYRSEAPYCYRCHLGLRFPSCRLACGDDVEKTIRKQRDELAAVIVEPLVQGAAGMLIWPRGYLKKISEICKKNQVLLILDEVFTGFGRTGKMFACQHEGIQPDLMALSKGLTGGYMPLAATLTSLEVYEAFLGRYDEFKTFFHGHSFTGNQLGCALALANLKLFKREGILRKTARRSRVLAQSLAPLKNHSKVGDIRQVGLIAAVEMVKDKATGEAFHLEDRIGHRIAREAQDRGMIIRPLGNVVSLIPPLSATEAQIRKMGRIVCDSIRAVCPEE